MGDLAHGFQPMTTDSGWPRAVACSRIQHRGPPCYFPTSSRLGSRQNTAPENHPVTAYAIPDPLRRNAAERSAAAGIARTAHAAPPVVAEDPRCEEVFEGIRYPSSDGLPMSDNEWQSKGIHAAYGSLDVHFQHDPNVYVVADILVYPTQGESRRIGPDILVAKGVPKLPKRSSYKVWLEGKPPDFVLEIASPSTWRDDRGWKARFYAEMGVAEYWLFDAKGDLFQPPLEGHRLESGVYRPLPARASSAGRVLKSAVLGLELRADGELLRFRDPATGEDLRTHREEATARREEATARHAAEARVAELEALVRELRPRRR